MTVADAHNQVLFIGGLSGELVDSVTILHHSNNLCSLAVNPAHCHALSECVTCVNATDLSLLICYNAAGTADTNSDTNSNYTQRCSLIGGEILDPPSHTTRRGCGNFSTCRDCRLSDTAQAMNCCWCGFGCVNFSSQCNMNDSSHLGMCPSDACRHTSCEGCLSDRYCSWVSLIGEFTSFQPPPQGCHSNSSLDHYSDAVNSCPPPAVR